MASRNEALDIDLPQVTFYARDDNLIDLAGFTRLTEKTIAQALAAAGASCQDWVAKATDAVARFAYLAVAVPVRRRPPVPS